MDLGAAVNNALDKSLRVKLKLDGGGWKAFCCEVKGWWAKELSLHFRCVYWKMLNGIQAMIIEKGWLFQVFQILFKFLKNRRMFSYYVCNALPLYFLKGGGRLRENKWIITLNHNLQTIVCVSGERLRENITILALSNCVEKWWQKDVSKLIRIYFLQNSHLF